VSRLAAVALCVLATVSLNGQTGPTFRAGANYVRVDMYATKDGVSIDDLTREEVEVLEDGVPQKIEAFEHVRVAPAGPQALRAEPTSLTQSREMAGDPRARVFIIFLDTYHTRIEGSANMRQPLVRFLDRVLGQDDMVAIMTPEMAASDIALGRKTTVISNIMQTQWTWGRRNRLGADNDPKEDLYERCYGGPAVSPSSSSSSSSSLLSRVDESRRAESVAAKMKARRREKMTLDALEDLIVHLDGIREERKAVLTVTEGWRMFTPDAELAKSDERSGVGVRPGDALGRPPVPRPSDANNTSGSSRIECEADKTALALMDHSFRLREISEAANRGNVTFYPVFARGLVPFDSDIGPEPPPTLQQDAANLSARQDSLRFLADMTDGTSVINTNNIEGALTRITDDLSSYYLFGYYSTNGKLDGRFRDITVRVKRPGAKVRARRGYRGRTAEEVLSGGSAESRGDAAVTSAMSTVAGLNNRAQFRIRSASWSRPGTDSAPGADAAVPRGAFWLVGELDFRLRKELAWTAGAVAELTVVGADGSQVLTREIKVAANQGTFTLQVPESGGLQAGEYAVRVRLRPEANGELALSDLARVIVGAPRSIGEAVLWRRGPTTGPQYLQTADPRFSRSDRIRLELATASPGPTSARLLDRVGKPLQVPLQVTERPDPSGGFSWVVVDGTLSPLAGGDYAIEVTHGGARQVTAFRIVP
jgi:VWFA-related protein